MLLKATLPDLSVMSDMANFGLSFPSFSSLSQVTLPNLSTIRYLPRWLFRHVVDPSPEGSRIHICFFFICFPLAFSLLPNVSCVRYCLLRNENLHQDAACAISTWSWPTQLSRWFFRGGKKSSSAPSWRVCLIWANQVERCSRQNKKTIVLSYKK